MLLSKENNTLNNKELLYDGSLILFELLKSSFHANAHKEIHKQRKISEVLSQSILIKSLTKDL